MKKVISVLLAMLCVFSVVTVFVYADDDPIQDKLEEVLDIEIDDTPAYGIVYQKGDARTMYMPATTVKFGGPGYAKVPNDKPIAIGKKFRCWKDENGKDVFPGDEIYVGTMVYLTASWSNSGTGVEAIDATIAALNVVVHSIEVALKIIDTAHSFRPA